MVVIQPILYSTFLGKCKNYSWSDYYLLESFISFSYDVNFVGFIQFSDTALIIETMPYFHKSFLNKQIFVV